MGTTSVAKAEMREILIEVSAGKWRRRLGGRPTYLATFWGGALFAFAAALVRWLTIGRVSGS